MRGCLRRDHPLPGPDPSRRDSLGARRKTPGASPCRRGLPALFAYEEAEQGGRWGSCPCLSQFFFTGGGGWGRGGLGSLFASTPPRARLPQGATLKPCQAWHSSPGQGTRAGAGSLWRKTPPGAQGPGRKAVLDIWGVPLLWETAVLGKKKMIFS